MSFSSSGRHYRRGNYGSNHYQKRGIFGKLFEMVGSGSWSRGRNRYPDDRYRNEYPNEPMYEKPLVNQNSIFCKKCNAQIPPGSKFCLQCGEKVEEANFCMNCGEKLPSNAKFCLKCGTKVKE